MNTLYEAALILGRAIDKIDQGWWTQGAVWNSDGQMCAVGLLTSGGGHEANYLTRIFCTTRDQVEAMYLASDALRRALTAEQVEATLNDAKENRRHALAMDTTTTTIKMHDDYIAKLVCARDGSRALDEIEKLIVHTNDMVIEEDAEARRWFSDALDLLAAELPVPALVTFSGSP